MTGPVGYCTVEDVEAIFKAAQDIIKIGSAETDNLTRSEVEDYIKDVEDRLNARLTAKYPVPLQIPVDNIVNQIVKRRVAYDIFEDSPMAANFTETPVAVTAWKDMAVSYEKDILAGRILLTVSTREVRARLLTNHLKRMRNLNIRISGYDWNQIGYEFIVPKSIVVRAGEAITSEEFILGVDYEDDAREGLIRRLADGGITNGQSVYLSFLYLETQDYQKGTRIEKELFDESYQ